MREKIILFGLLIATATSCISTRNTIKNIDDKAPMPALSADRNFILTEKATDTKYGYDPDYPVNLGFMPVQSAEINVKRFFGALTGPEGQEVSYRLVDSCCPFPSGKNNMGAGLLDIYEVTWHGLKEPKRIHINLYERGRIMAPAGFGIKEIK
ncbi:2-dehydro-3-deoxyphosphooctonate aldolase [Flavobacterium sp. D11R37]|uniref:2-dehydro-3-deoxyphosphooctonate aldolase n=1 Tax=Flavobacterium coralii TaxID=2838017 RepID=UPI001CA66660|nr:2-dehydro-3-deoxyphosphooctonate aldolase [Flavobacterium coralii]MBY8961848.1 2-dehydro-3-deoxyphosphooctonate aldolase [Flavobacterium coralii]